MRTRFAVLLLLAASGPARAQLSSPCDHYLPTGAPLPRDAFVSGKRALITEPTFHGRRAGVTTPGDKVTVLQECGKYVRVRTSDDQEGWLSIFALPQEVQLARQAAQRLPASNQECELRFTVPYLIQKCEGELERRQARVDELAHSTDLAGESLRSFANGKTLELSLRDPATGLAVPGGGAPATFLQANGQSYGRTGSNRWLRGRWSVEGDQLCLSEDHCGKLRQLADGRTVVTTGGQEFLVSASAGDPLGLEPQVRKVAPYAAPPPVPDALIGLAHPAMGW